MRIDWSSVPIAIIPRPRCVYCGSPRPPIIVRSAACGDGSQFRRCVCRDCSEPFGLLLDSGTAPEVVFPVVGNAGLTED